MPNFWCKYLELLFMEIKMLLWYTNPGDDDMDEAYIKIEEAGKEEIDELLAAAIERKRELFPQWEILYLALPKGDTQKWKETLNQVYSYLELGKDG